FCVCSSHVSGGRHRVRATVPYHLLPHAAREVGPHTDIILDTGIRSGADIIAAIALGAKFTLVGRAYLYALMAGGQAGVDQLIHLLTTQITRTMKLLQTPTLHDLTPHHATQLHQLMPQVENVDVD